METLGEYLRTLRELKNLPIRKVAAAVDIDQSTLGKYERNERLPKRGLLSNFASFFDVSLSELEKRYLTDKVVFSLLAEENPESILVECKDKLNYLKNKNGESKINE
jgi:transcriptional regulator with XRE-family HTH domain